MSQGSASTVGTYIYCIAEAQAFENGSPPFTTPGIDGPDHPVRTVKYADLVAVVSDAQHEHYDVTRENLQTHARVLEEAMTRSDVLLVSFGIVSTGDQEVQELLLKREADELHRFLEYVHGRIELDLSILWNREQLFSEIVAESDEIRALRDSIAGQNPDAVYQERVRLGELTAAAIDQRREQEAQAILEALEPLAVETKLNDLLTDMMILNAAFLVDKSQEQAFDAEVQAIGEGQADRLIFRYVGPLPPYNFINIRVRWEEGGLEGGVA